MKICVFDLETRLYAIDLDPENEEHGWELLRQGKGGISALVIYDSEMNWTYLYDDNSILAAAKHLESADLVAGYFSEKFDLPVIEGVLGRKVAIKHHYDVYTEISKANAQRGIVGYKGDFTLDSVCQRTIGRGKIFHGSNIKTLIAEKRFGELFNYCSDDVHLTYDLLKSIGKNGGIQSINNSALPLPRPNWMFSLGS